jgi:RimJ/RimL family protein N-acetyltransferase
MKDHGLPPVVFRFYDDTDREQIETFRCAWRPWERDAQEVIRNAPSQIESDGVELLVADLDGAVVGVAVFRMFEQPECMIYALGVISRLWDRGIGTRLKEVVMVEATLRRPGCIFTSQVFRQNRRMIHVNEKLHAVTEINPDDMQYFFTYVTINVEDPPAGT